MLIYITITYARGKKKNQMRAAVEGYSMPLSTSCNYYINSIAISVRTVLLSSFFFSFSPMISNPTISKQLIINTETRKDKAYVAL